MLLLTPALAWAAESSNATSAKKSADLSSEKQNLPTNGSATRVLLPAVRRIGIDAPTSNVSEFRQFMRSEARTLSGASALPFDENELSSRISRAVENAVRDSGRFWNLSVDSSFDLMAPGLPENTQQEARKRLAKDYDLDAWLATQITFSPDHTAIRLALKSSKSVNRISPLWAREDIFIEPQASVEELQKGINQAMIRLISTLGADGAVTYEREQSMVVDFGQERGLAVGAKLEAGLVLLSAYHPQTGEFLRSRSVPLYRLEVTEVREGSALCRVVEKNKLALGEAQAIYGKDFAQSGNLLAWRIDATKALENLSETKWKESRAEPFPLVDAAEPGFAPRKKQNRAGKKLAKSQGEKDNLNTDDSQNEKSDPKSDTQTDNQADHKSGRNSQSDGGDEENSSENADNEAQNSNRSSGEFSRLRGFAAGLGMTFGSLNTKQGDRYTSFPSTVFSSILAEGTVDIDEGLYSYPAVQIDSFSGGDVTGSQFELTAPIGIPVWKGPGRNEHFYAGGGIGLGSGSVKTVRVKKYLSRFDLFGYGRYESTLPAPGKLIVQGALSMLELFSGTLGADLSLTLKESKILPHELGLNVRLRKGPGDWSQISLGFVWEFMGARRHHENDEKVN